MQTVDQVKHLGIHSRWLATMVENLLEKACAAKAILVQQYGRMG